MWTIRYGRDHLWDRRFETRRAAMLAWVRAVEPALVPAPDADVMLRWPVERRGGASAVRA